MLNAVWIATFSGLLAWSSCAVAKVMRVDADFNALRSSVLTYQLNTGELPRPEVGLQALVVRPDHLPQAKRWTKIADRVPLDPWNRPYRYVAGDGFPDGFGIYSVGKDGVSATQGNDPDDRNSWTHPDADPPESPAERQMKLALLGAGLAGVSFHLGSRVSKKKHFLSSPVELAKD